MNIDVKDGIIDSEVFNKEKIRILFILKQAHNIGALDNWSLPEVINEMIEIGNLTQVPTFNGLFLFCTQFFGYKHLDVIKKIAYINVIKESGESTTSNNQVKEGFSLNKDLLMQQINEIDPNVIIFAGNGIGENFRDEWKVEKREKEADYCNYFYHKNLLCILTYHPSAIYGSDCSFSQICIPELLKTIKDKLV